MQRSGVAILQECLVSDYKRKVSMENFKKESAPGGQTKRCKDTLKASLKDFNILIESWEQAVHGYRAKLRCLIGQGAAQYEAKRVCEAERKRKEHKTRAKGSSSVSESFFTEFTCSTCSTCNRQFRAKVKEGSHQRTQITNEHINIQD